MTLLIRFLASHVREMEALMMDGLITLEKTKPLWWGAFGIVGPLSRVVPTLRAEVEWQSGKYENGSYY